MTTIEFYKSQSGQGDEDWYYLIVDAGKSKCCVKHTWSHCAGTATYRDGETTYSLEEFAKAKPNQYRKLLEWLAIQIRA